jgi:hypothetical protein
MRPPHGLALLAFYDRPDAEAEGSEVRAGAGHERRGQSGEGKFSASAASAGTTAASAGTTAASAPAAGTGAIVSDAGGACLPEGLAAAAGDGAPEGLAAATAGTSATSAGDRRGAHLREQEHAASAGRREHADVQLAGELR